MDRAMRSTGANGAMAFFFPGPKPQSLPPVGDGGGGSSQCLRPYEHRDVGPQHGIGMGRLCESSPRGKSDSHVCVSTPNEEVVLRMDESICPPFSSVFILSSIIVSANARALLLQYL